VTADQSPRTPALEAIARDHPGLELRVVRTRRATSPQDSAELQGIGLERLIRTIVVRRGADDYVFVLVPGGRQIDWPRLRATLGVSRLSLPDAEEARLATGYERGAITPFGAARTLPVLADPSIADHEVVAIGGGAHGINLHLRGRDLLRAIDAVTADVTKPAG
jgi:Cys-tRNA(Pro) deacylase